MGNLKWLFIMGSVVLLGSMCCFDRRFRGVSRRMERLADMVKSASAYYSDFLNNSHIPEEKTLMVNEGDSIPNEIPAVVHCLDNTLHSNEKQEKVQQVIESLQNIIWDLTLKFLEQLQKDQNIIVNDAGECKEQFKQHFNKTYHSILDKNMKDDVIALDRHKVAAITAIAISKSSPILNTENFQGRAVWNESLAINVALAYMMCCLNEILRESGKLEIEKYIMPDTWSCDTNYAMVLVRDLSYAKEDNNYNALTLANNFFLLEHLTLIEKGMDVSILKEKKRHKNN